MAIFTDPNYKNTFALKLHQSPPASGEHGKSHPTGPDSGSPAADKRALSTAQDSLSGLYQKAETQSGPKPNILARTLYIRSQSDILNRSFPDGRTQTMTQPQGVCMTASTHYLMKSLAEKGPDYWTWVDHDNAGQKLYDDYLGKNNGEFAGQKLINKMRQQLTESGLDHIESKYILTGMKDMSETQKSERLAIIARGPDPKASIPQLENHVPEKRDAMTSIEKAKLLLRTIMPSPSEKSENAADGVRTGGLICLFDQRHNISGAGHAIAFVNVTATKTRVVDPNIGELEFDNRASLGRWLTKQLKNGYLKGYQRFEIERFRQQPQDAVALAPSR
ncbi:YopT-type cysteine protease domain-containing protein [Martelella sp. HB161492]|uniref:YopT-type cysteine protease domain-containing protein n=1 Tax=Martelella sp. HB161492 TaxID=2720726 RepID=UPI0015902483|nr:YopT-type cysteine protease domain-containing protein [Martelella sp. HB161492]